MAAPCTSITDGRLADLLEEIFVRLPTPADLVRASVAFHHVDSVRQVITDRKFLRRFRKEHSPTFIGFIYGRGFRHMLRPHSTAPIATAVARAADFTFSFLPRPSRNSCWTVQNIRDGRVLLDRRSKGRKRPVVFPELAVCDPLHRQYRLLPPIPEDLTALVNNPLEVGYKRCYEVILVPPGQDVQEEEEETSFRVIWMAHCKTKLVASFYSSSTGQWQLIASTGWSDLLPGAPSENWEYSLLSSTHYAYAYGCLYWLMNRSQYKREVMLVLDTARMEFSVADFPHGSWRGQSIAIVEAGEEGRLGLITFSDDPPELRFRIRQNTSGSFSEWKLEKIIPLDKKCDYSMVASTERYLLLRYLLLMKSNWRYDEGFSLDVKTFQLERVCEISGTDSGPIYTSFPPSLSSSTV